MLLINLTYAVVNVDVKCAVACAEGESDRWRMKSCSPTDRIRADGILSKAFGMSKSIVLGAPDRKYRSSIVIEEQTVVRQESPVGKMVWKVPSCLAKRAGKETSASFGVENEIGIMTSISF